MNQDLSLFDERETRSVLHTAIESEREGDSLEDILAIASESGIDENAVLSTILERNYRQKAADYLRAHISNNPVFKKAKEKASRNIRIGGALLATAAIDGVQSIFTGQTALEYVLYSARVISDGALISSGAFALIDYFQGIAGALTWYQSKNKINSLQSSLDEEQQQQKQLEKQGYQRDIALLPQIIRRDFSGRLYEVELTSDALFSLAGIYKQYCRLLEPVVIADVAALACVMEKRRAILARDVNYANQYVLELLRNAGSTNDPDQVKPLLMDLAESALFSARREIERQDSVRRVEYPNFLSDNSKILKMFQIENFKKEKYA